MYDIVRITSYLIRQFFLPNPFTNLFKEQYQAEIVNWICGFIFVLFASRLTGIWYDGQVKTLGSLGFLVNYVILIFLFLGITNLIQDYFIVSLIFLLIYILLYKIEFKLFASEDRKFIFNL